jgi:hypothetical protein
MTESLELTIDRLFDAPAPKSGDEIQRLVYSEANRKGPTKGDLRGGSSAKTQR